MRNKALLIGINDYADAYGKLSHCVKETESIEKLLSRHYNGDVNFECKRIKDRKKLSKEFINKEIEDFFSKAHGQHEIALFYFSGHGDANGFIDIDGKHITYASVSEEVHASTKARNNIVILDCCHSGQFAGMVETLGPIKMGTTFLMSSEADSVSLDGLLGRHIIEALDGAASNILGEVSMASIYGYVDKLLKTDQPRPIFSTHVQDYVVIRKTKPKIEKTELLKLTEFFTENTSVYKLDPSYEPDDKANDKLVDGVLPAEHKAKPENTAIFKTMQTFNRFGLLKPKKEEHMYYAAIRSDDVLLTQEGCFYWELVKRGRL